MSQALARKVNNREKDNGKPQGHPLKLLNGGKGKSRFPVSMDNYGPEGMNAFGWGRPVERPPAKKPAAEENKKEEKPPEKSSNTEAGFSPIVEGLATM